MTIEKEYGNYGKSICEHAAAAQLESERLVEALHSDRYTPKQIKELVVWMRGEGVQQFQVDPKGSISVAFAPKAVSTPGAQNTAPKSKKVEPREEAARDLVKGMMPSYDG